ncbi:PspC domain-containing protein [Arcicella rosea]|uniref:Phage shock protein PspC (Stress-responsive transcriptional regulator) n=1 Tax=Arcicella rosea TaxID=502909 RepID=A0A841EMB0_9BACT|nr:PspC domain-containing protein [Arcicella rosea]MBB6005267.1 phage shock protein PspC (stress-responsive transcriptional regulator) [Arcicella rosea]
MKKTISINIAGIVFHIEEDGFERLNAYLKSIQKYFASYEGSKEIVADIEARIAEKFWTKHKSEDSQVITLEDVDGLIASMGSVSDFAAIEEEEDFAVNGQKKEETKKEEKKQESSQEKASSSFENFKYEPRDRKLYRDTKRKLLGGVCAGLAHNLGFDPLWIRLAFLFCLLGIGPITAGILSGITFVLYIACWIAFPANAILEEDERIRKFYRNPDGKVMGGVVSGIASYTGWDLGMLRFVFVLSIFLFGSGIVLYLILWAIAPEAKSLTDKMQMSGEPITLENIESNIKRTLHTEDKPEEPLTRLLLLPFRIISQVFKALGPITVFLASVARIFVGGMMAFSGVVFIIALFFSLFVGLTALENANVYIGDHFPVGLIARDASPILFLGGFLALAVPAFLVACAGVSLVIRRNLFTPITWQSLLGVFLIGLLITMYTGVKYAKNFAKTASIEENVTFNFDKKIPIFDITSTGLDQDWEPSVELIGYDGEVIKIEKIFRADGVDKKDAEINAMAVTYNIIQKDSILKFDDRFEFKDDAYFRDQRIRMKVYIPYGKSFSMTRGFASFVDNDFDGGYFDESNGDLFKGSLWQFTKDGELVCQNRFPKVYSQDNQNDDDNDSDEFQQGVAIQTLPLKDFEYIDIKLGGVTDVQVRQGDEYKVEISGTNSDILSSIQAEIKNNTLVLEAKGNATASDIYEIHITMPKLKGYFVKGSVGTSKIKYFEGETLELGLENGSILKIKGRYDELNAKLANESKLESFDLEVNKAKVEVKDMASAEINVHEKLEAKTTSMGTIHYRGEPSITRSVQAGGSVTKDRE